MLVTPIEIRQKRFEKSFRGYNTDEVSAFLHSLAYAWEKLISQLQEVESALESNKKEVRRLQEIENALLKTLKDSEVAAQKLVAQAQQEAALKAIEVKLEAEQLIQEAHVRVKIIEEEGQEAEAYRDALVQQLQNLAKDILAKGQSLESSQKQAIHSNEAQEATGTTASPELATASTPALI